MKQKGLKVRTQHTCLCPDCGKPLKCANCGGTQLQRSLSITSKQARVFILKYVHGLTQEQTATVLGISQSAVSQLLKGIKKRRPDLI